MGLREGYKDYYIYHRRLENVQCHTFSRRCSISAHGMHFQKVFNGNVTKEELNKLKRKYKLYRKEELQQQTTIDDYLF